MKCDEVIQAYLKRSGRYVPLSIRLRLIFSAGCRKKLKELDSRIRSVQGESPFDAPQGMNESIMRRIALLEESYQQTVSVMQWLLVGGILFGGIMVLRYSIFWQWASDEFGMSFDLPLSIVFGLAMTTYILLFVGSHTIGLRKILTSFQQGVRRFFTHY